MLTIETSLSLSKVLEGKTVGFIPTMGALHAGHTSLVAESKRRGLYTVVSIFVNPTQFNDPKDFEKYPIDIPGDLKKLEAAGCDLVFIPKVDEVYPKDVTDRTEQLDFGLVATKFEGEFRPGHFKGVAQVVYRLFDLVEPNVAFFGRKDFQQLAIVKRMVEFTGLNIEIIGMPTVREADGLAMSSRNQRLNVAERKKAILLYQALNYAKINIGQQPVQGIIDHVFSMFASESAWDLEYFDIVDDRTFERIADFDSNSAIALIAAKIGDVRLLDNMVV